MKKDASLVLSDNFHSLTELLCFEGSGPEHDRYTLFEGLLSSYEGFDIIEVICREAAVLTGYHWIGDTKAEPPTLESYLERVLAAARKYAASEDWPRVETRRAEAFVSYLQSL